MLNRVVKIGGAYLTDPVWLRKFGQAMASYGPAVIVHGGGTAIKYIASGGRAIKPIAAGWAVGGDMPRGPKG